MRAFLPLAVLAAVAQAMEISTSPPPNLKYSDFALDGKTTYCYTVKQGLAAAMAEYTQLGAEGKGDECPLQLTLEQTMTGAIGVNTNVEYKVTATVSTSTKNIFNGTALEKPVEDPITKKTVQISHVQLHACSSSSVCDAFRKGNNSRESDDDSGSLLKDGKAVFTPTLNFTTADKYTVLAVVMLPGPADMDETMRFVAFTTTNIGSAGGASNSTKGDDVSNTNASKVPTPSPTHSVGSCTTLAGTIVVGVTAVASLLLAF